MSSNERLIGVIGALGIRPIAKLSIPSRRLLVYLALRGGSAPRFLAAAELWPDCPDEVGRANLRRTLWQVPDGWIVMMGDMLSLDAYCDLQHARRYAARALEGQRLTFDEIDTLCGDVLPGWHDQFRRLRIQALEAACRTLSAQANHALAIQAGAAAVAAEPLCESASEALIEAHLAQHNRFDATRCFIALTRALRDELGVAPNPELVARMAALTRRAA
jgi:hypothetical protein